MTPLPEGAVRPAATRVLLALCDVHAMNGRATVRDVAQRAGMSVSPTHAQLRMLRSLGLVAWRGGKRGTLRPLVREEALCLT